MCGGKVLSDTSQMLFLLAHLFSLLPVNYTNSYYVELMSSLIWHIQF